MLYWRDFLDTFWSALVLLAWVAGAGVACYWAWLVWKAVGLN